MIALKYNFRQCSRDKMVHEPSDARVSCRIHPMTLHTVPTIIAFSTLFHFSTDHECTKAETTDIALKKLYVHCTTNIGKIAFIKSHII